MRVRFWAEGFGRSPFTGKKILIQHFLKISIEQLPWWESEHAPSWIRIDRCDDKDKATVIDTKNDNNSFSQIIKQINDNKENVLRAIMEDIDTGEIIEIV